ncbi:hypothetical protein SCYAM73S_04044 [Streptomyces cyaneofuscatus]
MTLRYFEAMSAQIVARGGTPEKFIGDAVMAVFGVPVVREDDARRALAAALGMRRALDALNEELYASLGIRLTTRIGVNTGQVVAGSDTTARQALVFNDKVAGAVAGAVREAAKAAGDGGPLVRRLRTRRSTRSEVRGHRPPDCEEDPHGNPENGASRDHCKQGRTPIVAARLRPSFV